MTPGIGAEFERADALLPPGDGVAALGGGADSAVAAYLVARVGRRRGRTVGAVFVDHGLEQSAMLRDAARRLAGAIDVPLAVVPAPVERGAALETRLRDARRAALETAAGPAGWIATGHSEDDQAETVLGNVLRGAGLTGLVGMRQTDGRWVRPVLHLSRARLRGMALDLGLPFFDDPDNEVLEFRRNRIRHRLLPQLEAEFNPKLRPSLARMGRVLSFDDERLEAEAARDVPVVVEDGAVLLPAGVLATVPPAVARRGIRQALRAARPPHAGSAPEVEAVLAVGRGEVRRSQLDRGWIVEREGPMVALHLPTTLPVPPAVELTVPGSVAFGGRVVVATRLRTTDPNELQLDPRAVGSKLALRTAEDGERIELESGSALVRDMMAAAGIPARLRARWPVVSVRGKIAGLVGGRPAAWARVGTATSETVRVSIERTRP